MGNCWGYCTGIFRREANRIQRGGGSKYFRSSTTGEHYTIEFENLVESDEVESPQSCPRPINEEEINHLKEHRYTAISDQQTLIDLKLQAELEAEEERLRLDEEARNAAQRQAARVARERRLLEEQHVLRTKGRPGGESRAGLHKNRHTPGEYFDVYLQNVKAQSEAFRGSRLPSETTVVTPNTESSWDFTTKTRSSNDDGTSLDLEWEDEEGMTRVGPAWERSRTEEDILRAALRPGPAPLASGPASASEDSNALEWENDFVSALTDEVDESEYEGFVNPVLETPSDTPGDTLSSDTPPGDIPEDATLSDTQDR